jgi:hypothetical protein
MTISTCATCGLRNHEGRTTCLRCGDPLRPESVAAGGPWREGDVVVIEKGAVLPDRCVSCGAPSGSSRLRQRYYWHHPALYILAFGALLVYAIVASIVRKSATLEVGLCPDHQARRRRAIAIGWGFGLVGLLGFGVSLSADLPALIALALSLMLAGLLWGMRGAAPLRAAHIDDTFVRLKGAGPGFLRGLPAFGAFR